MWLWSLANHNASKINYLSFKSDAVAEFYVLSVWKATVRTKPSSYHFSATQLFETCSCRLWGIMPIPIAAVALKPLGGRALEPSSLTKSSYCWLFTRWRLLHTEQQFWALWLRAQRGYGECWHLTTEAQQAAGPGCSHGLWGRAGRSEQQDSECSHAGGHPAAKLLSLWESGITCACVGTSRGWSAQRETCSYHTHHPRVHD